MMVLYNYKKSRIIQMQILYYIIALIIAILSKFSIKRTLCGIAALFVVTFFSKVYLFEKINNI